MQRSADEVRQLAGQAEGATLEFKRSAPEPRLLSRLISAFANSSGGTVLFGVDETASERIVGVDPKRTVDVIEVALRRLDPIPPVEAHVVSVDGRSIVALDIEASDLTSTPEGVYVKVGDRAVPASATAVSERVQRAVDREPAATLESLSRTIARQTQLLERQTGELEELRKELKRGSHWSRQLFWCLLGVILGTLASVLVATLL